MVFKGTENLSAGDISRSIEYHGGSMNAATQLETTHYYIDVPSYGAEPALNVLIDTILHPTFPEDELERERLVILEEIHRRDDSPDATLWDEFASHVFRDTPYGIKVIGNEKTVSSLTRHDLTAYFQRHYVPENLTVVLAGDFDKEKVLKTLERQFGKKPKETPPAKPIIQLPPRNGEHISLKRPVQLCYMALGIPTIGLGHCDVVALDLLADVLGGGRSARLHRKLREETETVLSISCDYISFNQKGLFAIFAETLPQNKQAALNAIQKELNEFATNPIKSDELQRAKARIKSDWLHGSETPHGQASTLGSLSAVGHLNLVVDYLPRLETLTTKDLLDAFNKHLAHQPFSSISLEPSA